MFRLDRASREMDCAARVAVPPRNGKKSAEINGQSWNKLLTNFTVKRILQLKYEIISKLSPASVFIE
jgi:hypothetical protein